MDTRLNPFSIDFLSIPSPTTGPSMSTLNPTESPFYDSFGLTGKSTNILDHTPNHADRSFSDLQPMKPQQQIKSHYTPTNDFENYNPLTGRYDVTQHTYTTTSHNLSHISNVSSTTTTSEEHSDDVHSTSGESDQVSSSDLTTSINTTGSGGEEVDSPTAQKHKFAPLADVVTDSQGRKFKKPTAPYIAIISTAILKSPERKLLLSDIYDYFMDTYPYFKHQKNNVWKNSIRHNLSLNECFVKNGRSNLGKGNYWSVHAACEDDFSKGNFSRRRARRRAKRGGFAQIQLPGSNLGLPAYSGAAAMNTYMPMSTVDTNVGMAYRHYSSLSTAATSIHASLSKVTSGHNNPPLQSSYSTYGQNQSRVDPNASFYASATHSSPYASNALSRPSQTFGATSRSNNDDKATSHPPPNINAAHMAQLGLTGAYNTPLRSPYLENATSAAAGHSVYGQGYSGAGYTDTSYAGAGRASEFGNLYTSLMF